jgi:hypothetical protein
MSYVLPSYDRVLSHLPIWIFSLWICTCFWLGSRFVYRWVIKIVERSNQVVNDPNVDLGSKGVGREGVPEQVQPRGVVTLVDPACPSLSQSGSDRQPTNSGCAPSVHPFASPLA